MPHKDQSTTADFLTWEENERVINELYKAGDYRYMLIFMLGTHLGLRISDIKKITWDDVIRKKRIIINEKKTGKPKNIKVNVTLQDAALQCYKELKPKSKYVVHTKYTQVMNRKLKRIKDRYDVDIENFSTHTFRKTFGRRIYDKHGDKALYILMRLFNHSDIETTKVYIGVKQKEYDAIYDDINVNLSI